MSDHSAVFDAAATDEVSARRGRTCHEPTGHEPTGHEFGGHGPTGHEPTNHEPTAREFAGHGSTGHGHTNHQPTNHEPTDRESGGSSSAAPDQRIASEYVMFQSIRDERSAVPVGDPPDRDVPGVIGATGLESLDVGTLLSRLEQITTLEAMLAAEKAATLAATAARLSGISADLGHENPRPGDRQAHGAERRWHNGLLRSVADETGLALGLQRRSAARRINESINLITRFPTTLQWLSDGRLPERAALTIASELGCIDDPVTRQRVERKVLTWVDSYGPMRVKRTARREAAKVTAELDSMKYEACLDERCVQLRPLDAGVAELAVSCSAINAVVVMNSLSKAAVQCRRNGDERSLDQLRADIAVQRLIGRTTSPTPRSATTHPPGQRETAQTPGGRGTAGCDRDRQHDHQSDTAPGADGTTDTHPPTDSAVQAEVVIHCTAGEAKALSTGEFSTGGDLDGYGPLLQPALWEAFRTAKIRYRLTDREPTGDPNRYQPSSALVRHITDRDRTCQAPGCSQPAMRCDIDHRVEHPTGKTNCLNCSALCRHHHRLKHRGGWKLRRLLTGEHRWTTPTGRTYTVAPPDS